MKAFRLFMLTGAIVILSACASTSSSDISLIPTQTDAITQKKGAFTQPIKWSKHQPKCKGKCPYMEVDSLVFPGKKQLTELVDQTLAAMVSELSGTAILPSITEFESYFWDTAAPSDEVYLAAKTIYRNKNLTILELGAWEYRTGAAHGMSNTLFINWSQDENKVLTLNDLLLPGAENNFFEIQRNAHKKWLKKLDYAQDNPEQFNRIWPFQPTNNVALTDAGVLVKYEPYAIAPYAAGMPQFLIPYNELKGVLKKRYLPEQKV